MKSKLLFFLIFFLNVSFVFSNPFFSTQNQNEKKSEESINSPTPVRTTAGNSSSIKLQGEFREKIATLFQTWQTDSDKTKVSILLQIALYAFLYGIIHAAGPGHRKTIVFSLYLTRKAPWWEPSLMGFILAALHAGCTIVLVLFYKGITGSIAAKTDKWAIYLEGFSYLIVIVTAIFLIIFETCKFIKGKKTLSIQDDTNIKDKTFALIPFLISGTYPCPGVILVLILSSTLNLFNLGIFAVIAMSLGMIIPIIASGYIAWFGKQKVFSVLKNKANITKNISFALEIFGYIFMLIFSVYIAMPFFVNLFN